MANSFHRAVLAGMIALGAGGVAADTTAPPPPTGSEPPAAPASSQPAPPPAEPGTLEKVAPDQVVALLGLTARGNDGKEIGRIVDVLVDGASRPRAAVVDVGGFLGMGSRKVAVEWSALHFTLGKTAAATLGLPSDRIKSAPTYSPDAPVEALGLPEAAPQPAPPAAGK